MTGKGFRLIVILLITALTQSLTYAQKTEEQNKKEEKSAYIFVTKYQVKRTPVKNQYKTSTCWCFSTISFLESEFIGQESEEIDLSEMFIVRHAFVQKANNYIRLHGKTNFARGWLSHNVIDIIRRNGIVPENVYTGKPVYQNKPNHEEMATVLKAMLDAILKRSGSSFKERSLAVTPKWKKAFEAVLDAYLGRLPETFHYKGRKYTPKSFASDYLKLNPDDYIELTSYTHHPFYQKFRLQVPDNYGGDCGDNYYNVPIDELERIVDSTIKNGFSIVWDGDVSERDYSGAKTGYGIVPLKNWEDKTKQEKDEKIVGPVKEKEITQQMRQENFDNFTTTDDHLMHIVGIAYDQNGTKFYLAKDSFGTDRKNKGYVYLSRSYFRLKTVAVMINKRSLPSDIAKKLDLIVQNKMTK